MKHKRFLSFHMTSQWQCQMAIVCAQFIISFNWMIWTRIRRIHEFIHYYSCKCMQIHRKNKKKFFHLVHNQMNQHSWYLVLCLKSFFRLPIELEWEAETVIDAQTQHGLDDLYIETTKWWQEHDYYWIEKMSLMLDRMALREKHDHIQFCSMNMNIHKSHMNSIYFFIIYYIYSIL